MVKRAPAKRLQARPTADVEIAEIDRWHGPVAGVDEAGRGPLAGPVVAAAVLFERDQLASLQGGSLAALNDSKAVREDVRELLHDAIVATFTHAVAIADVQRIDRDNILNATMWAMQEAVRGLARQPASVLVDGNRAPQCGCPTRTIIKGDAQCLSIAAASIVAKVHRDRLMRGLASRYPEYGFDQHKGYGTRAHLEAIDRFGVTDAHRRSFRPVRQALQRRQGNAEPADQV